MKPMGYDHWTRMGLVMILLLGRAAPQATTCFSLARDSVCGKDFEGLPVPTDVYKSNEDFNRLIGSTFGNVESVASEFESVFGCPTTGTRAAITSLRFQVSYACADAVSKAIAAGCTPANTPSTKGPALCLPQCEMAVTTLEKVFQDQTVCPGASNTNRSLVIAEMRRICGTYRPAQLCSLGTTAEGQFCGAFFYLYVLFLDTLLIVNNLLGWSSQALAQTECVKLQNDNCCTKLLSSKTTGPSSNSTSTALPSKGSSGGLSPGILALIIVAALVTVLCLGLFLYFKKRASARPTLGRVIPPYNAGSPAGSRDSFFDSKSSGSKHDSIFFAPMGGSVKSPQKSEEGYLRTVTVTHPYEATLQDELALSLGDQVHIVKEFDDGWALGIHAQTNQEGAFPLVCTEDRSEAGSDIHDNRLTLPASVADPDLEWIKAQGRNTDSIRISKRLSSQLWERQSRVSSDGRSSVNPFRGLASPSRNSFGSPLRNTFKRDMVETPMDDYYDELDSDVPSVPSKKNYL